MTKTVLAAAVAAIIAAPAMAETPVTQIAAAPADDLAILSTQAAGGLGGIGLGGTIGLGTLLAVSVLTAAESQSANQTTTATTRR
jgi:hypothetical protein